MSAELTIAIAQIDPTVGDIPGNVARIRAARADAAAAGADLVVLSELVVVGYPPEDLVLKHAFQEEAKRGVEELARDTADEQATIDVLNASAQTQLRTIIERVERLEEDKAGVMADLKEVYAEAKGNGFDTKILRKVVRMRKQDKAKLQEEEALIDLYLSAIGGL